MADLEETTASDPNDLVEVTGDLESDGYEGQFSAVEDGVMCLTCRKTTSANQVTAEAIRRTEGASDPDDMVATVALVCPQCQTKGTLIIHFGTEASPEEQEVFRALDDNRDRASGGQDPVA